MNKDHPKSRNPLVSNCYWVVPGKFLAGEYPRNLDDRSSKAKITALINIGITSFIDLTEAQDGLEPYADIVEELSGGEASVQRFPVPDYSVPRSQNQTLDILNHIGSIIEKNGIVYLHCWGGIGRTGTIVGCWLVRQGYSGSAALIRLRELWAECPKSLTRKFPETEGQERYIINWKEPKADSFAE